MIQLARPKSRALKIRGIAPHRADWKVSLEMGRSASWLRIELA
jgi:hypothetical protein